MHMNNNDWNKQIEAMAAKFGCTKEDAAKVMRMALVSIADARGVNTADYCKAAGIK